MELLKGRVWEYEIFRNKRRETINFDDNNIVDIVNKNMSTICKLSNNKLIKLIKNNEIYSDSNILYEEIYGYYTKELIVMLDELLDNSGYFSEHERYVNHSFRVHQLKSFYKLQVILYYTNDFMKTISESDISDAFIYKHLTEIAKSLVILINLQLSAYNSNHFTAIIEEFIETVSDYRFGDVFLEKMLLKTKVRTALATGMSLSSDDFFKTNILDAFIQADYKIKKNLNQDYIRLIQENVNQLDVHDIRLLLNIYNIYDSKYFTLESEVYLLAHLKYIKERLPSGDIINFSRVLKEKSNNRSLAIYKDDDIILYKMHRDKIKKIIFDYKKFEEIMDSYKKYDILTIDPLFLSSPKSTMFLKASEIDIISVFDIKIVENMILNDDIFNQNYLYLNEFNVSLLDYPDLSLDINVSKEGYKMSYEIKHINSKVYYSISQINQMKHEEVIDIFVESDEIVRSFILNNVQNEILKNELKLIKQLSK